VVFSHESPPGARSDAGELFLAVELLQQRLQAALARQQIPLHPAALLQKLGATDVTPTKIMPTIRTHSSLRRFSLIRKVPRMMVVDPTTGSSAVTSTLAKRALVAR
jgi:hypothetical protein